MRALEHSLTPRRDEAAGAVEHDHRVAAAVEHVDAVLWVDRHAADIGEVPAIGQACPVWLHSIGKVAAPDNSGHGNIPQCGIPRGVERIERHFCAYFNYRNMIGPTLCQAIGTA
jgi:hypothetical protein